MFKELKEFALKGNAIDLAVGIVLGVAFGAVITSLVEDLLMPPIGLLLGGADFSNLFVVLKEGASAGPYATLLAAQEAGAVTINVGLLFNAIIAFAIVAVALFFVVRTMNRLRRVEEEEAPAVKECPFCLTEIPEAATRCPACTSEQSAA